MKYIGLDGKEYKLNPSKYLRKTKSSKLYERVREFLLNRFPSYQLIEEVPIKGSSKGTLYFDFMIPQLNLCLEANGQQHFEHISFFHTKSEFLKARQRDVLKRKWCGLNNFVLIEFNYNETEEDWAKKL